MVVLHVYALPSAKKVMQCLEKLAPSALMVNLPSNERGLLLSVKAGRRNYKH